MGFINPGILLMILVAAYQSMISMLAKELAPHMSISLQVLVYYTFPLFVLMPWVLANITRYKTNRFFFYLLRGFFASASVLCFFYASNKIALSDAALLFNLTPIFVPLFARLFLGEVTSNQVLFGIMVSLVGVIVVMHPTMNGLLGDGSLIGLASGVFMALAQIMLRYLAKLKESTEKIVFYIYATSVIFSLITIAIESAIKHTDSLIIHPNGHIFFVIVLIIALGVIGLIAQRTMTKAFHYLPASKLVPLLYISVPISSLLGWILWKQQLTLDLWIGASFILTGVLLITFEKKKEITCVVQP